MQFMCYCNNEDCLMQEMRQLWGKLSSTTLYSKFPKQITEKL